MEEEAMKYTADELLTVERVMNGAQRLTKSDLKLLIAEHASEAMKKLTAEQQRVWDLLLDAGVDTLTALAVIERRSR